MHLSLLTTFIFNLFGQKLMLENKDFIIFSDDWGRHPFSCQHIMEYFLPSNRLLWVNTIGMRTPELSLYDIKRAFGKVASWIRPTQATNENTIIHPNLHIISPFMIPYNTYASIREFNAKSVVNSVLKASQEWGFTKPILLTTQPLAADYIGKLNEEIVAYYCVDDFINWPGMNQPKLVQGLEDDLLKKSDLVFAVSDSLCKSRTNKKDETKLLTHGVDIPHFAKASLPQESPIELKDIKTPIIGFYGLIDKHFDVELVEGILKAKPEWNVVCIGTKRISLSSLENYTNFYWFDAIQYSNLPSYAAQFTVAIIPYHVNEHTQTANPLKLREYIATEKPIVTTPMNEVFRFSKVINIAERGTSFIQAIENALENPIDKKAREESLIGESWQDKAELVSRWIKETLEKRQ